MDKPDGKYKRILICGGRTFIDWQFVQQYLTYKRMSFEDNFTIIHGDAKGADTLGKRWAELTRATERAKNPKRLIEIESYPAQWDDLDHPDADIRTNKWGKKYNKNAGTIRNRQMLVEGKPDLVIAFPGGSGTANMIRQSLKAGIKVIRVKPKVTRK